MKQNDQLRSPGASGRLAEAESFLLSRRLAGKRHAAFALVEVVISMGLILVVVIAAVGGIIFMGQTSGRVGDYTAATSVARAKIEDIRAATYNPPNYPFQSTTLYLTNSDWISLDQAGATFKIPGTVISKIEPVASGHLITVTARF